jgi:hypothetical protein
VASAILAGKRPDADNLRTIASLQADLGETINRYDMLVD